MKRLLLSLVVLPCLVANGCFFGSSGGGGGGGGPDQLELDIEEYNQLVEDLDTHRSEFMGEIADNLSGVENTVFWLEFRAWDPTLHSFNTDTASGVNYTFSIGGGDDYNFRASTQVVATASPEGTGVTYSVYHANQPESLAGQTMFDGPNDNQKWYAYDVDGTSLYVVVTGQQTTLYKYIPGGTAEPVTTLESAGCNVEIFWDFAVEGDTMIFVESGRIWRLTLSTNTAEWLGNETEISGTVDFRQDGVLFVEYTGPFFYEYATGETLDITEAIANTGYQINESFTSSHLVNEGGITRFQNNYFVYIGNGGVFAYDFVADKVYPVMLEPHSYEIRIEYRYPVVLDNGNLFVTGLTSTSGSVGADGPVYRANLNDILP